MARVLPGFLLAAALTASTAAARRAEAKTVAGLVQILTRKDYMPFFEANYWGTGMP
jgi:hypothetical protein